MTNNKVIVHMPGGDLQVEVEDDGTVIYDRRCILRGKDYAQQ